jgi:hypothetical protein
MQRQFGLHFRKLLRHGFPLNDVLECRPEPLHDGRHKRGFPETDFGFFNPADGFLTGCCGHRRAAFGV